MFIGCTALYAVSRIICQRDLSIHLNLHGTMVTLQDSCKFFNFSLSYLYLIELRGVIRWDATID
jgi:hypothetical protein